MTVQKPDIHADPAPIPFAELFEIVAAGLTSGAVPEWSVLERSVFGQLGARFGLTEAETAALALLAGTSLSRGFAEALAERSSVPIPTVGSLRALLPELTWERFAPASVLRAWHLIQMHRAANLRDCTLTIDPRILDWCLGTEGSDARLLPYARTMSPARVLAKPHAALVQGAATALAAGTARNGKAICAIVGEGIATRERIAEEITRALGMTPLALAPTVLEGHTEDSALLLRLAAREAVLSRMIPVIGLTHLRPSELEAVRQIEGPVIVLSENTEHRLSLPVGTHLMALNLPDREARADLWQAHLALAEPADVIDLAEAFAIGADEIAHICEGLDQLSPPERVRVARAEAHRVLAPPPDPLILEIHPRVGWRDLVLPPSTEATLRAITAQARHRATVYHTWRFADRASRGLAITALFTGPSGTGKTLAAEVMAADLGQRLLRVNLAQVVDKYVGETEKHLDHVFSLAERSGAILLFDEAEALFRQRGDGNSAQERFASMTAAYLLQRLECCTATCLLTTNMRSAIDEAFLRRIRFVVQFAFPGLTERRRLWQGAFPAAAPVGAINVDQLATLPATGGTIRNAALNAAFLAADAGGEIDMTRIVAALELENTKLAQPIDLGPLRRRVAR